MANSDRHSVFISAILDSMGFNRHMIDFRINNTRYLDVIGGLHNDLYWMMITGGKAEGTSNSFEGDLDYMLVDKLITVSGRHVDPPSPQHTVLYTEVSGVHPGYTWLRVGYLRDMIGFIRKSLVLMVRANSDISLYVSSSYYNQINRRCLLQTSPFRTKHQPISGPSLPAIVDGSAMDSVRAFSHPDWPIQASQWMDRCRTKGWPPDAIVTAIVQSGCHIVPKGLKGSPSEHMEWCISFAAHEKSIIQLFNLTQKHVYILLKLIAKDLKESHPVLQDLVTSYTMKTVALWQAEIHHTSDWNRSHLLDRLMEALYFLKSCVESQYLPAYFIPENNLFDGKINYVTAELLSRRLDNLLSRGAACILTFPSMQHQLHIMQIPGMRQRLNVYSSGFEMWVLIRMCCRESLLSELSMKHIPNALTLTGLQDMTRHRSLIKGCSKVFKATFAYINIAKIRKAGMSNRRKYELYRSLLHFASANIDTDKISGKVKFAGVLHVLGKSNKAIETLYSVNIRIPLGLCWKENYRNTICKRSFMTKINFDDHQAVITRLGRDKYLQECASLAVRYSMEEIDIVPHVIKYELFHVPNTGASIFGAYVDPDVLRTYLMYKCHTELGDKANAQAAFINLIRLATHKLFQLNTEYREVSLNVLGLCYLEKGDYLRSYICFCRAMSLRPRLLVEGWSTSTPWHLAVLASKLINS